MGGEKKEYDPDDMWEGGVCVTAKSVLAWYPSSRLNAVPGEMGVSRVYDREEADTYECHEGRTPPAYGGGVLS